MLKGVLCGGEELIVARGRKHLRYCVDGYDDFVV